ncbi:aminotransferase class V-fold PLP-dependent enzyme [Spirillospora sp. NBC_01491]|uniref:aminotransferase class V-fold PLP-dependent enzyme n=1 Tax=Spirillospora sp. NBC_01491 TaxID=2976007 RepID=UPI002E300AD7|nr:aminotransferase class V-fold PLP-dependent enzyme [Spirillospora sp. NBC_01491]
MDSSGTDSAIVEMARRRTEAEAASTGSGPRPPAEWAAHVPSGPLEDPSNWRALRALFPLDPELVHLNVGTLGSTPRPVLEMLRTADAEYARYPRDPYPPTTFSEPRAVLARCYGCDPDEIAIVQGATDGNARILNGLELAEGDEVITTTHECYTMQAPLNVLHNRRGVVVKKLTPRLGPDQSAEEIVEMFEAAITPRTKVIEWAAVTFTVGTTMPTRALAELAHRHGLISVVDGAHLPGQFDMDLHELGVDFLSGSGAKYQCGPMGTGIVYARNKVLPEHNPLPLPAFWPVISLWYPIEGELPPRATGREPTYDIGTFLQKTGSADLSRGPALQAAAEIWEHIGRDNVQRYVHGLCDRLKERVVDRWGAESLFSPLNDRRLHSGMVAFQPFADPADAVDPAKFMEFEERMESEYGVNLRFTFFPVRGASSERYAIRLAPHLYNSPEEIDGAVDAMIKLTDEMATR